jgi:hypothetical protein
MSYMWGKPADVTYVGFDILVLGEESAVNIGISGCGTEKSGILGGKMPAREESVKECEPMVPGLTCSQMSTPMMGMWATVPS